MVTLCYLYTTTTYLIQPETSTSGYRGGMVDIREPISEPVCTHARIVRERPPRPVKVTTVARVRIFFENASFRVTGANHRFPLFDAHADAGYAH